MGASHVVVVGGGFAGIWATAAACAMRASVSVGGPKLDVTLVTADAALTVRPRLYEAKVADTAVPLEPIMAGIGARLHVSTVTAIDTTERRLVTEEASVPYDALVLAAGSSSPLPDIPGLVVHAHRIDDGVHATRFRDALAAVQSRIGRARVSVVGGGLAGIELAAELASEPDVEVSLFDGAWIGGVSHADASKIIRTALVDLGVALHDHCPISSVGDRFARTLDGATVDHDLLVWCGGLRASPLTAQIPAPRDELGRLHVDANLAVRGVPAVWAAGDVARTRGNVAAPMSCQFALPTGRIAGHNAAASLVDASPAPFHLDRYVTCVDLGDAGALFTTGWERKPVSTGSDGKAVKHHINYIAIHPPEDPEEFLASAVPGAPAPWT